MGATSEYLKRLPSLLKYMLKTPIKEDAISWVIDECRKRHVLDPDQICRRLLVINMVAVHTSTIAISNTILDIYSSPHVEEFVRSLREECSRVYSANNGIWTKDALNDLHRIDSAIRESLRYSSIAAFGIERIVSLDLHNLADIPMKYLSSSSLRVQGDISNWYQSLPEYPHPTWNTSQRPHPPNPPRPLYLPISARI